MYCRMSSLGYVHVRIFSGDERWIKSAEASLGNCATRVEVFSGGYSYYVESWLSVSVADLEGWKKCYTQRNTKGSVGGQIIREP